MKQKNIKGFESIERSNTKLFLNNVSLRFFKYFNWNEIAPNIVFAGDFFQQFETCKIPRLHI